MIQTTKAEMSLDLGTGILNAAIEKARSLGVLVNIAVFDAGPNLKGFFRMDGALLGAIDVAMKKARTARLFEMESGGIGELSQRAFQRRLDCLPRRSGHQVARWSSHWRDWGLRFDSR